jgi:integrase
MAQKLTDGLVRAAQAEAGQRIELADAACVGLRLRVSGDVRTWAFVARPKGSAKVIRLTLGRWPDVSLSKARALADTQRLKLVDGRDIVAAQKEARSEGVTFGEIADEYLKFVERTKRSWKNDQGYLRRPLEKWCDRPALKLEKKHFTELLSEIAATAPVSANRTQSVLRTLLGWAVERGKIPANVLAGAKKIGGKEISKDRLLSDKEVYAFDLALDDPLSPTARAIDLALRTILLTCQRPGEVAGMRVDELQDLDGKEPAWTLPGSRTKNGKANIVPLSPAAVETIKEALLDIHRGPDGASEYVFASKWNSKQSVARHSLSQAVKRLCAEPDAKANGLLPFTPHDLRRTGATLCRAAGVPRDVVAALLNHTAGGVTAIYDRHAQIAEKREAVSRLAEKIEAIKTAERAKAMISRG